MRPTTKDLARAAGVSLATVDRVLNDRTGVRDDTVRRVTEAIEAIGFIRNLSAANLARSRNYRFLFLLPLSGYQFLAQLIARIDEASLAFTTEATQVTVAQIEDDDPHQIAATLGALDPAQVDGVAIMAPESPQLRDAKTRLTERGIEAVAFLSGQIGSGHLPTADEVFVGIDNHAAGATAGRLMGRFSPKPGKILVVAETLLARDSLERRLGFDVVISRDYPHLTVLPSLETHSDPDRTARILTASFTSHPDITGLYVLGSEARMPLQHVPPTAHPVTIAHERTPYTEFALQSGQIAALITQDSGHLVRSAIRILRARCDRREVLASQEKIRIEILIRENL
ncbi:MAG: LacI family DNA-binding transcriptional regulator [Candidatus Saccharibacteria bacterium]|nr:LacI family DNA-binding transcriptional regulator [Pseudorhodobacter sp.]